MAKTKIVWGKADMRLSEANGFLQIPQNAGWKNNNCI